MANKIDVNYSQMQNARKQMLIKAGDYQNSIAQVRGVLTELRSQWEGDAQAAFDTEQAQAMAFYNRMTQRVAACANVLAKASARYAEADHSAAEMIRSANH